MKIRRLILSAISFILVAATLAVSLPDTVAPEVFAAKSSVSDLQDEYKEMEEELKKLEKELEGLKDKKSSYIKTISNYNEQINIIEEQIVSADAQIALLELSVEATKEYIVVIDGKIAELQEDIDESYKQFKERLKAFHLSGETSELEILLGSGSFTEFLSRYAVMTAIAERDKKMMDGLQAQIDELNGFHKESEELQEKAEKELSEAEKMRTELNEKEADLNKKKKEAEKLLDDLLADEETKKETIAEINKDLEDLEKEIEEAIRNSTGDYVGGDFAWPCPKYTRISSPFGYRIHPITGVYSLHKGTDMVSAKNTPILAANSGKVSKAYNYVNGGYGKYIIIDHGGGYVTLYAHCNEVLVKKGDVVTKGQQIAKVGTTGNSTGYHLHFEIRINNTAVDPMDYFPGYK